MLRYFIFPIIRGIVYHTFIQEDYKRVIGVNEIFKSYSKLNLCQIALFKESIVTQ